MTAAFGGLGDPLAKTAVARMGKRPSGEGGDGRMDGWTDGKATQPAPRRAPAPCLHPFRGPSSSLPPLPAALAASSDPPSPFLPLRPRACHRLRSERRSELGTLCFTADPSLHSSKSLFARSPPQRGLSRRSPHVKQHRPQPSRLLAQPQFILWHLLLPGITIRVYASGFYYMSLLLGCKFNQSFFYSPLNP